jgi:hypothetical protein
MDAGQEGGAREAGHGRQIRPAPLEKAGHAAALV